MNAKFEELQAGKQVNIINASQKIFAKMGYRKASTADIALEAGISKSLLFHYFSSKLELFSYVFNYSIDLVVDGLKDFIYEENEDLFDMIGRANIIKIDLFKTHPYLYKFVYQSYFEEDIEVQAIVRKRNDALIIESYPDILKHMDRSKLKDDIFPEKALQIILWVSEGFLQDKLNSSDIDPDKLLSEFEDWMRILKVSLYK